MTNKMRHGIILVISLKRDIISVAFGGRGSGGTNEVAIHIVIIVVFRISTTIVVAKGIIIIVNFEFFIGINDSVIVIFGITFGCNIKVRLAAGRGWGTVIICLGKKIKMVAFEIIINVIFRIVTVVVVVVVVVNCESLTLNPAVKIIEAKGPIILGRIIVFVVRIITNCLDTAVGEIIINVVFGIMIMIFFGIVIAVVVIVNYEGPILSIWTLTGVSVLDMAVGIVILMP